MRAIERRVAALELRHQITDAEPALVQIIMEHGRTAGQVAAAAVAAQNGMQVIEITCTDMRRPEVRP